MLYTNVTEVLFTIKVLFVRNPMRQGELCCQKDREEMFVYYEERPGMKYAVKREAEFIFHLNNLE